MTNRVAHLTWLAAAVLLLGSVGTVSAQTGGGAGPPTYRPFPKVSSGTTGGGTATGGGTTTGGSGTGLLGGVGGVLTPAQELAVLVDTLTTAELILDSGLVQFNSEVEVLFLLVYLYETKYAQAVEAAVLGGSGGTGGSTNPPGTTTGGGTIPTTGTPGKP